MALNASNSNNLEHQLAFFEGVKFAAGKQNKFFECFLVAAFGYMRIWTDVWSGHFV